MITMAIECYSMEDDIKVVGLQFMQLEARGEEERRRRLLIPSKQRNTRGYSNSSRPLQFIRCYDEREKNRFFTRKQRNISKLCLKKKRKRETFRL